MALARCSSPGIVSDNFLSSRDTLSSPLLGDDVIPAASGGGGGVLLFSFLPRSRGSEDLEDGGASSICSSDEYDFHGFTSTPARDTRRLTGEPPGPPGNRPAVDELRTTTTRTSRLSGVAQRLPLATTTSAAGLLSRAGERRPQNVRWRRRVSMRRNTAQQMTMTTDGQSIEWMTSLCE